MGDEHSGTPPAAAPSQRNDARAAPQAARGSWSGVPTSAGGLLWVQRKAGNAATIRLVAARSAGSRSLTGPGGAPRTLARAAMPATPTQQEDQRLPPYSVVPEIAAEDRRRSDWDRTVGRRPPLWDPERGYLHNPTAQNLRDLIDASGVFRPGLSPDQERFNYVVTTDNQVVIGERWVTMNGERVEMPHATLIGGKDPKVWAAGEIVIVNTKQRRFIFEIDDNARQYRLPRESLRHAIDALKWLPPDAFDGDTFRAFHVEADGSRTALEKGVSLGRWPFHGKRRAPYSVRPGVAGHDYEVWWRDPTDNRLKRAYTPEHGYVRNPSAWVLTADLIDADGRIWVPNLADGTRTEPANGTYMCGVNENGDFIIGSKLEDPELLRQGRKTGLPHPTLIGGKNPLFEFAGDVTFDAGRLRKLNNFSGHIHTPRKAMPTAVTAVIEMARGRKVLHPAFTMESVQFDARRNPVMRPYYTTRLLELKAGALSDALRKLDLGARVGTLTRGSMRSHGGAYAGALMELAVQVALAKATANFEAQRIETGIAKLLPDIQKKLEENAHQETLDRLLEEDSEATVYINARFQIDLLSGTDPNFPTGTAVFVTLDPAGDSLLGYSSAPAEPNAVHEPPKVNCGDRRETTFVTVSLPVNPLELFRYEPPDPAEGAGQPQR